MKKLIIIPCLLLISLAFAQNDSLVNGNFETGDCMGWEVITGTVPSFTPSQLYTFIPDGFPSDCLISTNHIVVPTGIDVVCGIQRVFPGGGNYSLQLGNGTGIGNGAGRIKQTFIVDSVNNAFAYHYAVVLNDAGHVDVESPYFTARILDASNDTIHANEILYAAASSGGDPDFLAYPGGFYLDWKTKYINLSNYVGESVTVEFTTGDCIQGGHYAYAYIEAESIEPTSCMFLDFRFDTVQKIECSQPGFISSYIDNGEPPYTYNWSTGDTTTSISPTVYGIYDLTVTDSSGCSLTKSVLINGAEYLTDFDLEVNLSANAFIPGQTTRINIDAFNDGCVDTLGQLTLMLDGMVTLSSAVPTPDNITGNTLTWNTPILNSDSLHFRPYVYVTTSSSATLGDIVCFNVSITPSIGDADTTNNTKEYCYTVLNSYDPNYKEVYPKGECFPNYVLSNQELTYTVHFQNTGTASAINVSVLDTLAANLDINTVRVIGQSHDMLITEVENGNVLNFKFDNINLPDSATDEASSHGYVVFKVNPIANIPHQTRVENSVGIYFDYNLPIYTNTVFNTFVDSIPNSETILTETAVTNYDLNGTIYDSTGSYYQYFSSADGCDSTVILNLTISTTGISTVNEVNQLKLYPNPVNDYLMIVVPTNFKDYNVEIYNVTGKVIYTGKNTTKVNTASFAQGIYYFKLWDAKNTVVKKLVKE